MGTQPGRLGSGKQPADPEFARASGGDSRPGQLQRSRGALRPLKGKRKFGTHIFICSPQELQLGRAPEPRRSAGSSLTCLSVRSFVHSLIHLFNQGRGRPSPALGSPPAWVRPRSLSWSSRSEGETGKKSASMWCPCCGRWKG